MQLNSLIPNSHTGTETLGRSASLKVNVTPAAFNAPPTLSPPIIITTELSPGVRSAYSAVTLARISR